MPLMPGAEPFHVAGGRAGVVLCHGFTGTPASLRPWAEALAGEGYSVEVPRLPGHGTRWQELEATRWEDWYAGLERAFLGMRQRCDEVYVAGLSMGGGLALRLAEVYPGDVAGLLLVNPAVLTVRPAAKLAPLLRYILRSVGSIGSDIKRAGVQETAYPRTPTRAAASLFAFFRVVRPALGAVTAPILLFHSRVDHVVEPVNSEVIVREVSSSDVTVHLLEDSYHVATLDNDGPWIHRESARWLAAHVRADVRDAS